MIIVEKNTKRKTIQNVYEITVQEDTERQILRKRCIPDYCRKKHQEEDIYKILIEEDIKKMMYT